MNDLLTQIINILGGGLVSFGTKIGEGVQSIVQSLFVNVDGTTGAQTLTIFGIVVCTFAGIGLAVGLTKKIFAWVASLGGSK